MLSHLKLAGVGPAPEMEMQFGRRLNLITGDNGLGKSFILESAWWCLTRTWTGYPARPNSSSRKSSIGFQFDSVSKKNTYESKFDPVQQDWPSKRGRPANPGLVIYARVDGGFAVWDPARNYWRKDAKGQLLNRPPSYRFKADEVWDGLSIDGKTTCNGLIRDWVSWQFGDSTKFGLLTRALKSLSPGPDEPLASGKPTKIDIDDARQVPTLRMPYGEEVPVIFASAGIKRAIALAYLLVWSWSEHIEAARLMKKKPAKQVIFLVDEIEAHLHPKWQRRILTSLLDVVSGMAERRAAAVQVIAATHSPLVLASMEPMFDAKRDAWFDIDIEERNGRKSVALHHREFQRRGDASAWLTSEAFGLKTSRSVEAEQALQQAEQLLKTGTRPAKSDWSRIEAKLEPVLSDTDPFWVRWKFMKDRGARTK